MEVILRTEVSPLGREGDIVNVAPGYANNYLVPKGMAVLANKGNLKQLEQKRAGIEKRRVAAGADARTLADKFDGKSVTISAQAGAEGRLYGSVTTKDIAQAVQENFGIEIDRRRITPPDPIKEAGEVTVTVKLLANVEATLVVKVVPEIVEGAAEASETDEASSDGAAAAEESNDADLE